MNETTNAAERPSIFIGMDLHQRTSTFAVKDRDGALLKKGTVKTDAGEVKEFLAPFASASVVFEPVSQWYHWDDLLTSWGYKTHVVHPMKVKAIASARIKTDTIDASTLCDLLRANMLPEVWRTPGEVRTWKEEVRRYQSLVSLRVQVKNRIHSLLWKSGIAREGALFTAKGTAWLDAQKIPDHYAASMRTYRKVLTELSVHISEAEKIVEKAANGMEEARLLMTIPGIGRLTALVLMAEIGDIGRFPSPGKLMGYTGLVPSTYSSGGVTRHGKITRQGSRWLRFALVEIAHHQLLCTRKAGFRTYYARIKKRKGSGAAAVATARKLCAVIWRVLTDKRPFQAVPPVRESQELTIVLSP